MNNTLESVLRFVNLTTSGLLAGRNTATIAPAPSRR
jgi:hypothetical protein